MHRPSRRGAFGGVLLVEVLVSLGLPSAVLAAITQRSSQVGNAVARATLIRRAALGRGWTEAASAQQKPPPLTCPAFNPSISGVVEVGAAASPTYQQTSSGPFVSESGYVYRSASEQATVWGAVVHRKLVRCVAESLVNGSGSGVHFTVRHEGLVSLLALASAAEAYRVSGTASTSGQSVDVTST